MINERLNLQIVHLLTKKKRYKTEPCSVVKGLNAFAKSVNLHLPAQVMYLMDPQLVDIVFGIINHEFVITSLF